MRSLDDHVRPVTRVGESASRCRWPPLLRLTMIFEPPLPSSTAVASVVPLGEYATAVAAGPSTTGVPVGGKSTREPVASGGGMTPSGVGVAVGVGRSEEH